MRPGNVELVPGEGTGPNVCHWLLAGWQRHSGAKPNHFGPAILCLSQFPIKGVLRQDCHKLYILRHHSGTSFHMPDIGCLGWLTATLRYPLIRVWVRRIPKPAARWERRFTGLTASVSCRGTNRKSKPSGKESLDPARGSRVRRGRVLRLNLHEGLTRLGFTEFDGTSVQHSGAQHWLSSVPLVPL